MINNYIDKIFYCVDINFESIWISAFSIDSNRKIDVKFVNKRSILGIFSDGLLNVVKLDTEIRKVISVIEDKIKEKIYSVYLTSSILNINSQIQQIYLNIGQNKQVTNKDIKKSLELLKNSLFQSDQSILQIIPIKYNVDVGIVDNPVGYKTPDLFTTYNVMMADKYVLTTIKNIFEKYQICVEDIVSRNYIIANFILSDEKKILPALLIDITYSSVNINFLYKNKLVKCRCIQIDDKQYYNNYDSMYNTMQFIKNKLPADILNITKNIFIYFNLKINSSVVNVISDVFNKKCQILNGTSEDKNVIYFLMQYLSEKIVNDNDYYGISNTKLNMFSLLKNIIYDTL